MLSDKSLLLLELHKWKDKSKFNILKYLVIYLIKRDLKKLYNYGK